MSAWIPTSERLPEEGVEVLGFSAQWIHPDYNEKGIRACFMNDGAWISAEWNNYQDCYENAEGAPEYWQPLPSCP